MQKARAKNIWGRRGRQAGSWQGYGFEERSHCPIENRSREPGGEGGVGPGCTTCSDDDADDWMACPPAATGALLGGLGWFEGGSCAAHERPGRFRLPWAARGLVPVGARPQWPAGRRRASHGCCPAADAEGTGCDRVSCGVVSTRSSGRVQLSRSGGGGQFAGGAERHHKTGGKPQGLSLPHAATLADWDAARDRRRRHGGR